MPKIVKFHGKYDLNGKEHLVLSTDDYAWMHDLPGFVPWGSFSKEMVKALGKRSDDNEALQAFLKSASNYAGAVPTDVLDIHWERAEDEFCSWVKLDGSFGKRFEWMPRHWEVRPWEARIPNSELPIFFNGDDPKPVEATEATEPRSKMSLFELMLEESREKGRQEDAARPTNCPFKYL